MEDLTKVLKVNQLVHLELTDHTGYSLRYRSRVENVTKGGIILASPIKERTPLYIPAGTVLNVWYWDHVAIYTFRTTVMRNVNEEIPLLVVMPPDAVERVQNREYVRIQTNIKVALTYKSPDDLAQQINCQTRDISGGGMMLVLTKPIHLKKDEDVGLDFQLEDTQVRAGGTVIWDDWELDSDGIERNILGIKFTVISDQARQMIIRFVYRRQIDLRRRGLL